MTKVLASLFVVALGATEAQASWFQTNCSSADATVTQSYGHGPSYLRVTKRTWTPTGSVSETIELDPFDAELVSSEEQTLVSENGSSCRPGETGGGYGWWRSVSYAKVRITLRDGGLFDENVVGVTEDRTAVETALLCEHNGNSMIWCTGE